MLGCFLVGLILALTLETKKIFIIFSIGFLGSFTTMSAFTLQAVELHNSNQLFTSYSYILLTILLTIIATIVGINISKQC